MSKKAGLQRLLNPTTVAVIGGREAAEVIKQCRRIGFSGQLWPVNPVRDEIEGIACFNSVAELPSPPDASFVAVPPQATLRVIADLARCGAGGAVCYASGFAEIGAAGAELQRQLVVAAGDVALIGPNCHGALNYLSGVALWPDEQGAVPVERGVALILQSGNIAISLTMQDRELPISHVISVGNKADLDLHDYIEVLLDDARVAAIGLHIEGLNNVAAFSRAALAALKKNVPIVALKTGSSALGAEITMSHTSSLAGSDALYDALFERVGVARCRTLTGFVETLKFLAVVGALPGDRIASMSCSGGEASLVADQAAELGLCLPPLPAAVARRLHEVLGERVNVANPLDYHTYIWGDEGAMTDCFEAMLESRVDCTMLVIDYPRAGHNVGWEIAERALINASKATGQRAIAVSTLAENLPADARARLLGAGIAPMQGLDDCLHAIEAAVAIGRAQREVGTRQAVDAAVESPCDAVALNEFESKLILAKLGIPVPAASCSSPDEAGAAAEALGFPVAVKALSAYVVHKTEVGAVRLNLGNADAVNEAAVEMTHHSNTLLIEKMAAPAVAELIIGVTRDPQFGLAMVIGAGGTLVELIRDSVSLLFPVSRHDIEVALDRLRVTRLIRGFRSQACGDYGALVDALLTVAAFAELKRDSLTDLDINPLFVLPEGEGVVAVDAYIKMKPDPG